MAIKKPDLLSGTAQKRAVQRASEAGKAQAAKVQASGSSGGEIKKPVLKTWFSDTGNLDQVVDSFTGQVISAGKTSGTENWKTKLVRQAVGAGRGGRVDYVQVEVPTLAGRVASTVSSAAKSAASDLSNMAATLYESGQNRRSQENESLLQQYTQELERAQRDLQVMREMGIRGAGLQGQQNIVEAAQRKVDAMQKVAGGNVQQKATQAIRTLLNLGVGWDQIAETYPIDSASAARRYTGYVESGLSPEDAGGLSAEMEALEPETGKDSVTDLQRYRTVVDYGLSQQEQLTVLRDMMEDSEYENLMSAYQKGIAPEQFITFREGISGLSADKNLAGKAISGSKKRKVLDYIDAMDLNNTQKTALYYAAGYAASTLSDAPWYGQPENQWDIIPRLDR